ncbi:ribosomal protein S18-alanine N-acetyltransferase [Cellulomonas sp. JZ18]|uniref:ribosomal protein S18-alanine N-acetyltransferase n=1 Tax=Cellulomonas sp. JZ18 TaxID=2654191 RepID=UPI001E2F972C|nr:ribosomal protein S18-alanine N-acetyltransferase [Cellulomonas sp. JZ18]
MTAAAPGAPAGTPAHGAVTVRPLTPDDLPELVRMEGELFGAGAWSGESLREEITGPGRTYVGAVLPDGRLVGYAGTWFDGYDVQVMTVGTDAAHQGRGIGRLLLVHLLEQARGTGAESALLEVRVDNDPAIHLYESLGFTRLGRRRGYYQPEGVDAWTMRLELRAR